MINIDSYNKHLGKINGVSFTPREIDIISFIINGRTAKKIASTLNLSPKTVENYTRNIMIKVGCNSQEGIRDFVEQSDKLSFLRNIYQAILQKTNFEEWIKNAKSHITSYQPVCLILYGKDKTNISLIKNIERHLDLSGFKLLSGQEIDWKSSNSLFKVLSHIDCIIYCLSPSLIAQLTLKETETVSEVLDLIEKFKVVPSCVISLHPKDKIVPNIPNDLLETSYLNFGEELNYYQQFFLLLKKLIPNLNLDKVVSDFEKKAILPLTANLSTTVMPTFNNAKFLTKLEEFSKRFRIWFFYGGVLTVGCLIGLSLFLVPKYYSVKSVNKSAENTSSQPAFSFNKTSDFNLNSKMEAKDKHLTTWNLPFLPPTYIERVSLTETIWKKLFDSDESNKFTKVVGLTGLGGIGKTSLAMYCIHNPKQQYNFRAWFNAETASLLKANYFELGERLNLFSPNMSEAQKIMEVKNWLEKEPKILLVYDNVPNMSLLDNYLPNNAHIIITSRNYKVLNAVEVDTMTKTESLKLLDSLLPAIIKQGNNFSKDSEKLINLLNHIPLAISQAAAYIAENMIPISAYLELFTTQRKYLLSDELLSLNNQNLPIYTSWNISSKSILNIKHGKEALELLNLMSFCYSSNIPKMLLLHCLYGKHDTHTLVEFNKLIGILRQYSLITVQSDCISIHRLVSKWVLDNISTEKKSHYLRKIMSTIGEVYPKNLQNIEETFANNITTVDYHLIKELMPHIEAVFSWLEPIASDKELIKLYYIYADALYNTGNLDKSKLLLESTLVIKEKYYKLNDIEISNTLKNLAFIYNDMGQSAEVERILIRILNINEKQYGLAHIKNVEVIQRLSNLYYSSGNGQKCLEVLKNALRINEKYYGKNHYKIAKTLYSYASAYFLLGDFSKSKNLLGKALVLTQKHYEPDHIEIGVILHMLGWVHYALGNIIKAKEISENALTILSKHIKSDDNFIAYAKINLALINFDLGNLNEATNYLEPALEVRKKFHGPEHIWTAFAMADLGLVYASCDKITESKKLMEQSLKILKKNYNSINVWNAFLLNRISMGYFALRDKETSKELLIQALKIIQQIHGDTHIFSAIISANLGNILRMFGEKDESKRLLNKALNIIRNTYGDSNIITAKLMANLALLEETTEPTKFNLLDEATTVCKSRYDIQNYNTKISLELHNSSRHNILENKLEYGYFIGLPF